jgi:aldose 1-epimerase
MLWHDRLVSKPLILETGGVRLTVSPDEGGRMSSFVVGGDELLVTSGAGSIWWGVFPMVPFVGRVRHGSFSIDGRVVQLPRNMPPHAIHGAVFDRAWEVDDASTISIDLGPSWPWTGRVTQRFDLTESALSISLAVDADERMPAEVGWHPWFRRQLAGRDGSVLPPSGPVELRFQAGRMYARDDEGIPTGELVAPTPPPWDECFTDVGQPVGLTWPGRLELEIDSSCDHWVVYTEPRDAVCVEPQTGPPDAFTLRPRFIVPGQPLAATMHWRWRTLG